MRRHLVQNIETKQIRFDDYYDEIDICHKSYQRNLLFQYPDKTDVDPRHQYFHRDSDRQNNRYYQPQDPDARGNRPVRNLAPYLKHQKSRYQEIGARNDQTDESPFAIVRSQQRPAQDKESPNKDSYTESEKVDAFFDTLGIYMRDPEKKDRREPAQYPEQNEPHSRTFLKMFPQHIHSKTEIFHNAPLIINTVVGSPFARIVNYRKNFYKREKEDDSHKQDRGGRQG